ncbi:hypothetical protein [Hymenobacter busanensis]|uniref:hypothetical protein n=1 Tax=Hymenobacter busanensis TaxID=2607656 RepID=UPI0013675EEF|nr:hypothetical protein [Hymenobacter busanensis]QHJ07845.1 hypothetical protein GUY19_11365 [Hymenobacter busanensis]
MLHKYACAALLLATAPAALAQTTGSVGIGTATPNPTAALDISATGKGLLIPRMDSAARAGIAAPPDGLMVFQTDGRKGFWYALSGTWLFIPDKARAGDNLGSHTASTNLGLNNHWLSNAPANANGLRVDNGGNVGVGVGSPTQRLDVDGGVLARAHAPVGNQGAYLQWNRTGGDGETWLLNQQGLGGANAGIRFGGATTGNAVTEWARFLNNGNLGIGTTAPGQKLEVAGQVYSSTGGFRFPDGTVQTTAAAAGGGAGDNLGNHTATQSLKLNGQTLSNNGTGGLHLDDAGNVGVGTATPAGPLQVNGERINPAGVGVDQQQTLGSGSDFKVGASQSFTAGSSNRLVRVDIGLFDAGAGQAVFTLYQGAGTAGTLLSTQTFAISNLSYSSTLVYQSIVLPTPVLLTAGQPYTLSVQAPSGRIYFFFQSGNPYAGGTAIPQGFPGTDVDLAFKTYMTTPAAVESVPALTVLPSTNVGIGTAAPSQPLEVAGTVYSSTGGFMFPDGTTQTSANRALTLSGQNLTLTGPGGTTVALPTSPGDNLGNHTATQNLKLGTNALVGNGGSTGLSVTSAGNASLPAANAYTYAAAKTYSITYGISDANPELEGAGAYKIRVPIGQGEYIYSNYALRIPVHLPQGATITGIKCYGQDTDASTDLRVFFISVLPTDTGMGAPGSYSDAAFSSGTPGYAVLSFTPTSSRVIDNSRAYYVLVDAKSTDCAFGAVRVTYTVTQTE